MNLFMTEKQEFHLPDAHLIYIPEYFSEHEANLYFSRLRKNTIWQEDNITIFGKTYKQPRLTALYGTSKRPYSYSNITMFPNPFTKDLMDIKRKVETFTNYQFNSVLLNLYRSGNDSNGWHADNEKELGTNPVITSVTFGEERPFHFKHRTLANEKYKIILQHGSLLIMSGAMQHHWVHQIAKTKRQIGERINLTFRKLVSPK